METAEENIKTLVRESYTRVAEQGYDQNAASCCGSGPSLSTRPHPTRRRGHRPRFGRGQ